MPKDDREPQQPPGDWREPDPPREQTKVETVSVAKVRSVPGASARRRRR